MNLKKMSDKKLIEEAKELNSWIYNEQHSFDVSNELLYDSVMKELDRRGYAFREETTLVIEKA